MAPLRPAEQASAAFKQATMHKPSSAGWIACYCQSHQRCRPVLQSPTVALGTLWQVLGKRTRERRRQVLAGELVARPLQGQQRLVRQVDRLVRQHVALVARLRGVSGCVSAFGRRAKSTLLVACI